MTATDAMRKEALNQSAQFKIKIETLDSSKGYGSDFRIRAPDRIKIRGIEFPCHVYCHFSKESDAALSKLHKGSTVTVAGTIARGGKSAPAKRWKPGWRNAARGLRR